MKRIVILGLAALAVTASCSRRIAAPKSSLPLVLSIWADSTGTGRVVAQAGRHGAEGSIAIIGEPEEVLPLARHFQTVDAVDNIDGRSVRDSLPDFAGERFDVILDAYNEAYAHFIPEGVDVFESADSLREAAVRNAVFAWDTTCVRSLSNMEQKLNKTRAKILIFTSSMQGEFGVSDVDTLQRLCGGKSIVLSPTDILLEQAYADRTYRVNLVEELYMDDYDRETIKVQTSGQAVGQVNGLSARRSNAWQSVFDKKGWEDARLTVLTPEPALDIRTEFRNLLRQYRSTGGPLDALIVDSYSFDRTYLESELTLIRREGTEEDGSFNKMLSKGFHILDPQQTLTRTTYELLRSQRLFTHRIARPALHYYETEEAESGLPVLVEVTPAYVQETYVQDIR